MGVNRMSAARVFASALLALVLLASASAAFAAGRVASTYSHIGRLPNPENVAADTAAALRAARVRGDDRPGCGTARR